METVLGRIPTIGEYEAYKLQQAVENGTIEQKVVEAYARIQSPWLLSASVIAGEIQRLIPGYQKYEYINDLRFQAQDEWVKQYPQYAKQAMRGEIYTGMGMPALGNEMYQQSGIEVDTTVRDMVETGVTIGTLTFGGAVLKGMGRLVNKIRYIKPTWTRPIVKITKPITGVKLQTPIKFTGIKPVVQSPIVRVKEGFYTYPIKIQSPIRFTTGKALEQAGLTKVLSDSAVASGKLVKQIKAIELKNPSGIYSTNVASNLQKLKQALQVADDKLVNELANAAKINKTQLRLIEDVTGRKGFVNAIEEYQQAAKVLKDAQDVPDMFSKKFSAKKYAQSQVDTQQALKSLDEAQENLRKVLSPNVNVSPLENISIIPDKGLMLDVPPEGLGYEPISTKLGESARGVGTLTAQRNALQEALTKKPTTYLHTPDTAYQYTQIERQLSQVNRELSQANTRLINELNQWETLTEAQIRYIEQLTGKRGLYSAFVDYNDAHNALSAALSRQQQAIIRNMITEIPVATQNVNTATRRLTEARNTLDDILKPVTKTADTGVANQLYGDMLQAYVAKRYASIAPIRQHPIIDTVEYLTKQEKTVIDPNTQRIMQYDVWDYSNELQNIMKMPLLGKVPKPIADTYTGTGERITDLPIAERPFGYYGIHQGKAGGATTPLRETRSPADTFAGGTRTPLTEESPLQGYMGGSSGTRRMPTTTPEGTSTLPPATLAPEARAQEQVLLSSMAEDVARLHGITSEQIVSKIPLTDVQATQLAKTLNIPEIEVIQWHTLGRLEELITNKLVMPSNAVREAIIVLQLAQVHGVGQEQLVGVEPLTTTQIEQLSETLNVTSTDIQQAQATGQLADLMVVNIEQAAQTINDTLVVPEIAQSLGITPAQLIGIAPLTDIQIDALTETLNVTRQAIEQAQMTGLLNATLSQVETRPYTEMSPLTQTEVQVQQQTQVTPFTETIVQEQITPIEQIQIRTPIKAIGIEVPAKPQPPRIKPYIPILKFDTAKGVKWDEEKPIPPATITMKLGSPRGFPQGMWILIPYPYTDIYYTGNKPMGAIDATGRGSTKRTLQVLNPDKATIQDFNTVYKDIGVTILKIYKDDTGINVTFSQDKEDAYKGKVEKTMPSDTLDLTGNSGGATAIRPYQGKTFTATVKANTQIELENVISQMKADAEAQGMDTFITGTITKDPNGGYQAEVYAHNFNPFKWVKEHVGSLAGKISGIFSRKPHSEAVEEAVTIVKHEQAEAVEAKHDAVKEAREAEQAEREAEQVATAEAKARADKEKREAEAARQIAQQQEAEAIEANNALAEYVGKPQPIAEQLWEEEPLEKIHDEGDILTIGMEPETIPEPVKEKPYYARLQDEYKELDTQIEQVKTEAQLAREYVKEHPLYRMLPIWDRIQRRSDEKPDITLKEYVELTGNRSPQHIITDKFGRQYVSWDDAMDGIMSEYGRYETTDELYNDLENLALQRQRARDAEILAKAHQTRQRELGDIISAPPERTVTSGTRIDVGTDIPTTTPIPEDTRREQPIGTGTASTERVYQDVQQFTEQPAARGRYASVGADVSVDEIRKMAQDNPDLLESNPELAKLIADDDIKKDVIDNNTIIDNSGKVVNLKVYDKVKRIVNLINSGVRLQARDYYYLMGIDRDKIPLEIVSDIDNLKERATKKRQEQPKRKGTIWNALFKPQEVPTIDTSKLATTYGSQGKKQPPQKSVYDEDKEWLEELRALRNQKPWYEEKSNNGTNKKNGRVKAQDIEQHTYFGHELLPPNLSGTL
jgi:hypothetical protein